MGLATGFIIIACYVCLIDLVHDYYASIFTNDQEFVTAVTCITMMFVAIATIFGWTFYYEIWP